MKEKNKFTTKQIIRNIKCKNQIFYFSIENDIYFLLDKDNYLIMEKDKSITIVDSKNSGILHLFNIKASNFNDKKLDELVNYLEKRELFDRESSDNNYNSLINKKIKKIKNIDYIKNYKMNDLYNAENLVIGNLEYVSSEYTGFGPRIKSTIQYYIFEPVLVSGDIKYREIFTEIITDTETHCFDLPYVVNIKKLTDVLPEYKSSTISKMGLIFSINKINNNSNIKENNSFIIDEKKKKMILKK